MSNTLLIEHVLENVATNNTVDILKGIKLSGSISWRKQDLRVVMIHGSSLANSGQVEEEISFGTKLSW